MRAIDADALKEELVKDLANTMRMIELHKGDMAVRVLNKLDEAETLDVAPVVHAKWKVIEVEATQTRFACSKCNKTVECGNDYFLKPTKHIGAIYPYCHCGAKMDLKE